MHISACSPVLSDVAFPDVICNPKLLQGSPGVAPCTCQCVLSLEARDTSPGDLLTERLC